MSVNNSFNGHNGIFISPSLGKLEFSAMVRHVADFVNEDVGRKYAVIVGTDSEQHNGSAEFVSVVAVHRIGCYGRYFWQRNNGVKTHTMRDRIYYETILSLDLAQNLIAELKNRIDPALFGLEIHCDVGENGPTKEMIREIVGMVKGNGFEPKIKPDSWGATKVADRHV